MLRWRSLSSFVVVAASVTLGLSAPVATAAVGSPALARSPELGTATRLADRRFFVIGTRFYEAGAEDGSYPGRGFPHPRRDGRVLEHADQAARRCLVRRQRLVALGVQVLHTAGATPG